MSFQDNDTFIHDSVVSNINIFDVDAGFHRWWNEILDVRLKNGQGQKEKVPVVFVAPERWEIARREGVRDKNGTLILPIIAISRSGMSIANDTPTSRHFADLKEQVVYHREIDPKSSLAKELVRKQRENADRHVKIDSDAPIYQIYTRKAPDHYSITYEVKIWTPYIENMNDFIQKMAQKFDFLSVKSFKFDVKDKYYLVAFQQDEIADESNSDDYSGDERIIKKTFSFTVGADIHPENDSQESNFRKYYSQSKLFFKTKVVNKIPIIDPNDLAFPSSSVSWNPYTDPALIEGWDCYGMPLASGSLSSWVGVNGTVATFAGDGANSLPTGIVDDTGGTHPGVQFVSTQMSMPIGPLLVGKTRVGVVISLQNYGSTLSVLLESSPDFTANGKFAITLNNIAANDFAVSAYGGGNYGQWVSPNPTLSVDPLVLSTIFDFSSTSGSVYHKMDNVEVLGGGYTQALVTPGSTCANVNINFAARNGVSLPSTIVAQQIWFLNMDTINLDTLTRYTRYADASVGEVGA